jgi:hypothetical protein
VGAFVGFFVGKDEGLDDGSLEGEREGTVEGEDDGRNVGPGEMEGDGEGMKETVGNDVATSSCVKLEALALTCVSGLSTTQIPTATTAAISTIPPTVLIRDDTILNPESCEMINCAD